VYSPSGAAAVSVQSRLLRDRIKVAEARWVAACAQRVGEQCRPDAPLTGFFQPEDILVPVPGRKAGLMASGAVTRQLAEQLARNGVGQCVWCGLQRVADIPKSATAPQGSRPDVSRQYESLGVSRSGGPSPFARLMLIDDVISRGRTLLAAAMRLEEAFPLATVGAFALLRTLGRAADVERLLDPCVGTIRWRRGDAMRVP